MTAPRLYDHVLDADCYAVRLQLALLGVAYERHAVDAQTGRAARDAALFAVSPDGVIPVLDDGGNVVAGTAAILVHLATRHDPGGTYLPTRGKGLVLSWLGFATTELAALAGARQAALFGGGELEGLRTRAWDALRVLEDRMIERGLDGGAWIVGPAPSIADIACFPHVALSHDCGLGLEDFPALNLWQRRVRRLSGFVGMPGIPDYF